MQLALLFSALNTPTTCKTSRIQRPGFIAGRDSRVGGHRRGNVLSMLLLWFSLPVLLPAGRSEGLCSSSCSPADGMWGGLISPLLSVAIAPFDKILFPPPQSRTERGGHHPKMRETFRYHRKWLINAALWRAVVTNKMGKKCRNISILMVKVYTIVQV